MRRISKVVSDEFECRTVSVKLGTVFYNRGIGVVFLEDMLRTFRTIINDLSTTRQLLGRNE